MIYHATDLIGKALVRAGLHEPLPAPVQDGVCCLTGRRGLCIPRKDLIGESFTTQGGFMAPDSDLVGVNVWYAFKHRPERAGNWFCDGKEFLPLDRQGIRDILHSPRTGRDAPLPWAMYVTQSFKKHGSQVAPVNASGSCYVAFEIEVVKVDLAIMDEWNADMKAWQDGWIARADIQSGELAKSCAAKTPAVQDFLAKVKRRQHSSLYRMLAHLLPGKEVETDGEEEEEG